MIIGGIVLFISISQFQGLFLSNIYHQEVQQAEILKSYPSPLVGEEPLAIACSEISVVVYLYNRTLMDIHGDSDFEILTKLIREVKMVEISINLSNIGLKLLKKI